MPRGKHTQKTRLAYYVAVKVCNGKPHRVFRFVAAVYGFFHLFFAYSLFKAALKHDLRLIEPMDKKRRVFLPLLTQNDPFSSDFSHIFSFSCPNLPFYLNISQKKGYVHSLIKYAEKRIQSRHHRQLIYEPAGEKCQEGVFHRLFYKIHFHNRTSLPAPPVGGRIHLLFPKRKIIAVGRANET